MSLWRWFLVICGGLGLWGVLFGATAVLVAGAGIYLSLARLVGPLFALPVMVATFVSALWVGHRVYYERGSE